MNGLRILIADDHPVVRQGIRQILNAAAGLVSLVGEAKDGRRTLEAVTAEDWDLLLLDVHMPDRNGFTMLPEIRRQRPTLPVLMLSMLPEEEAAIRALKSGADGYLNKEAVPDELIKAVRKVAAHGKYVSPGLAERLACEIAGGSHKLPHERLSDREYQVMCMLATGKSISDIAAVLHRSRNTISTYRSRILIKMGVATNAELAQYAIRNHLIP
jgi:two-component system invasion response regulator UvrY